MTQPRNHTSPYGFKIRGIESTEIAPQEGKIKSIKGVEKVMSLSWASPKAESVSHICPQVFCIHCLQQDFVVREWVLAYTAGKSSKATE